jgi:hypothetical protein
MESLGNNHGFPYSEKMATLTFEGLRFLSLKISNFSTAFHSPTLCRTTFTRNISACQSAVGKADLAAMRDVSPLN